MRDGLLIFAGISSIVSYIIGNWNLLWVATIPMVIAAAEMISSSSSIKIKILKLVVPKVISRYEKRIEKNLRPVELPHKEIIIQRAKNETNLLVKCNKMIDM